MKGKYKGICNLSACTSGKPATWWNFGALSFYCANCAKMLNWENRNIAKKELGHVLCVEVPEDLQ